MLSSNMVLFHTNSFDFKIKHLLVIFVLSISFSTAFIMRFSCIRRRGMVGTGIVRNRQCPCRRLAGGDDRGRQGEDQGIPFDDPLVQEARQPPRAPHAPARPDVGPAGGARPSP